MPSRRSQDPPRRFLESFKTLKKAFQTPQVATRHPQDTPKTLPSRSQGTTRRPKTFPRRPKAAPKTLPSRPKPPPRRVQVAQEWFSLILIDFGMIAVCFSTMLGSLLIDFGHNVGNMLATCDHHFGIKKQAKDGGGSIDIQI